jgi:hypothetical protein
MVPQAQLRCGDCKHEMWRGSRNVDNECVVYVCPNGCQIVFTNEPSNNALMLRVHDFLTGQQGWPQSPQTQSPQTQSPQTQSPQNEKPTRTWHEYREDMILRRAARTLARLTDEHGPKCTCFECERAYKRLYYAVAAAKLVEEPTE